MKLIEKLSEMIEDEIEGADCYITMALKYKDEDPDMARTFYTLSMQELDHMTALHGLVVAAIDKYKREKGEPPEGMKALYDYLHGKHIEYAADVKTKQSMFSR